MWNIAYGTGLGIACLILPYSAYKLHKYGRKFERTQGIYDALGDGQETKNFEAAADN